MSDQPQNSNQNQSLPKNHEDKAKRPIIRTMKTDVEDLFRKAKPSLIEIIGKESNNLSLPQKEPPKKRTIWWDYIGRYVITAIILVSIASLAALTILVFIKETKPLPVPKLEPPTPFFATEKSKTVEIKTSDRALFLRLMEDAVLELERPSTIKRIIIKLTGEEGEKFAGMIDFFNLYRIKPPSEFLTQTGPQIMTFIFYDDGNSGKFGFAIPTSAADRTLRDLLSWEPSLSQDLKPLFFKENTEETIAVFEDKTYRNIDWRYLKLSQDKDFGIAYTIFPAKKVVVFTTSEESMMTIINRLFES